MKKWTSKCGRAILYLSDCRIALPKIKSESIDAIITDPPYAEVSKKYGRLTELEWFEIINPMMRESKRVLSKTGSAVYILQPNSKCIGSLRLWMFEFLLKWGREWNLVQDVWWWNHATIPSALCAQGGLCRPSLKICAWFGSPDCYRDQKAVLLPVSQQDTLKRLASRQHRIYKPSGHSTDDARMAEVTLERGGATPFNVLPIPNTSPADNKGVDNHGAATPRALLDWWIRFISKSDDVILDPFLGTGSTGVSAINRGRKFIGIECDEKYFEIAKKRIKGALAKPHILNRSQ